MNFRGTHRYRGRCTRLPVPPVAYQGILEPGIGQFREFEHPRVHTLIYSWEFFWRTN